ncbi:sigma-70 family RNA polymerase sigma factor [Paenibacillus rubinfantis]|uniref:sigma-70 family RNA polymerase sigma factor n=1 Tax=Paenibacillus rubinfantis TaxID=1720296 RepID=UPI00073E2436|nr:sigma-70 family RNA polymerase sigma factor [Paenibacillus rubinfantis]
MVSYEDEQLVAQFKLGQELAFNQLHQRYRTVIDEIGRKYFARGITRQDIQQAGSIGLYRAAKKYDPSRGVKFRTYAGLHIQSSIINTVKSATRRRQRALNQSLSLDRPYSDDQSTNIIETIAGNEPSPEERLLQREEHREAVIKLDLFLATLSKLERLVVKELAKGFTYKEVADNLGVTFKTVDNAFQRVKIKFTKRWHVGDLRLLK